ncbi:MAG: ATP-binding cassette domain-containing protein [Hyphomicrobiaceae bacterium]|nr:ATP-binding cassette domain-containing protein [Hyphomicrobiaceae bacterium]
MTERLSLRIDSKIYPTVDGKRLTALAGFELVAEPGSFTCLIGPSGCGKSTALRILMGLDRDFAGAVTLPVGRDGGSARLGVMFQEPRLLPWRTVEQNVRLALPDRERDRDLAGLFTELGLDEMTGRFPAELSGGLARRAVLARALAVEPELLILDEPFVSLDAMTAARLRRLTADALDRRRATTVMVTHDIREALALADRIVVMSARPGRVVGEMAIDVARAARDSAFIEAGLAELAGRHPEQVRG